MFLLLSEPSSPVIELLQPSESGGWNLTWKSDVTSRQDQYSVMYIRNDTRYLQEKIITRNWLVLDDLYPGAGYEIKVYAISFTLWSDPHSYFQTIRKSIGLFIFCPLKLMYHCIPSLRDIG
ncbi:UNVERIFIED_CONTAM: Ptp10D [Trichonephila clavipes]